MQVPKNMRKHLLATALIICASPVYADDCSSYPLTDGLSIEQTPSGTKYLSTATASVLFDDIDEVLDTLHEAELYAKANISEFFDETIQNDDSLDKAIDSSVKISGGQKAITKNVLKTQLREIRKSSRSLLKGVIRLGECYTKGKFVRVTVGLKPETIAAAGATQAQINTANQTVQNSNQTESEGASNSNSNLNESEGFSNSSKLSNF